MKSRLALLLLPCLLSTALTASTFSVSGRDILLNGQEFEVKGLCYQPTPIGESGSQPPFGDYYTFSTRNQALWDRDFPNFRKMGANVVRLYGWTPNADHSDFLAQAYNNGKDPVYILINRYIDPNTDWEDENAIDALLFDWEAIATELAEDPAIMGFLIGNEVNTYFNNSIGAVNGDSPLFWAAMEQLVAAVKAIAPDKLVSVAITDRLDQVNSFDSQIPSIDFWAMQVYRGNTFGSLTTGFAAASTKPLVITEFGYDALDGRIDAEWPNNAKQPAEAMEALWNELRADDALDDVIAGACVFEYADEWWKDQAAGNLSAQDYGPRWPGPFEDGQGNEEWWGIFRIIDDGTNIDILEPRAMFYRLAAMWNPPFTATLQAGLRGNSLTASFSYPDHLHDQMLEVQMSTDLNRWSKVADNISSQYLTATDTSVTLESTVVGETVQVSLQKALGVSGDLELLVNGGFETGDTSGWATGGSVSTNTTAHSGSHSLTLTASGGFSVPYVLQSYPASPGESFSLSGYLRTDGPLPDNATFGIFKIVFQNIDGTALDPGTILAGQDGPPADPGVESLPFLNAESPVGDWNFSEASAVAPDGTHSVVFFILNVDESPAVISVDSVSASRLARQDGANPRVFFRLLNNGR
jgi:hypothetical protein